MVHPTARQGLDADRARGCRLRIVMTECCKRSAKIEGEGEKRERKIQHLSSGSAGSKEERVSR